MYYIIKGHTFEDEVLSMLQMFYPNTNYIKIKENERNINENTVISTIEKDCCFAYVYNGKLYSEYSVEIKNDDIKEIKRCIKLSIYKAVKKIININLPWGILTGIRPAKRVVDMWESGYNDEQIFNELKEKYLVSENKIKLVLNVAHSEEDIIKNNSSNKIGLYIGIPFCPSRCLYCSFTSYSLLQYSNKVDIYLDCLEKEFLLMADKLDKCELESIYIGGGTPTSLNEKQLDRLLKCVNKYFKKPVEYTVEAGRPDTITKEKLKLLYDYGVSRISINPQTLNDKTLNIIGRKHTVKEFINAFYMAREIGHKNINTDLILGLPDESAEDVENTLKGICNLNPESVTIHTLAVKRASRLKENFKDYDMTKANDIENMLNIAAYYTNKMNMLPYYMYRQKNMIGNFENVGYCKKGFECIYNVQIMEEKQTIIALGAGGSTKFVEPVTNRIQRVFNVKSVDDYIIRIDEMLQRKIDFFNF